MNKRGFDWATSLPFIIIGVLIIIVAIATGFFESFPKVTNSAFDLSSVSFGTAWNNANLAFLDFIFGEIPESLVGNTNNISASIIVIGIWFLFLFVFGDIMKLFGGFSPMVSWIVATILTLIIANLQLIKVITVWALVVTAFMGALSVIGSIMMIFGIFAAFHFGTSSIRRKLILRRAEDAAIRAVAGGKKAASGVSVLSEIAEAATNDSN